MKMLRTIRAVARAIPLVLMVGCASAATKGAEPSARMSRTVLTQGEIQAAQVSNLYEAVERLRPYWLTDRGSRSVGNVTGILVYQGSSKLGAPDVLKQLTPVGVLEIRFVDGATASATLPGIGSQHVTGAIVVVTNR